MQSMWPQRESKICIAHEKFAILARAEFTFMHKYIFLKSKIHLWVAIAFHSSENVKKIYRFVNSFDINIFHSSEFDTMKQLQNFVNMKKYTRKNSSLSNTNDDCKCVNHSTFEIITDTKRFPKTCPRS